MFQMKLYDQCVLHVVNHQEQMDISVLPSIIRSDINAITTLLDDLRRWKAKIAEKEEVQADLDLWQYIDESLIVFYEVNLLDLTSDEQKYYEEIQENVAENDKKMQYIDMELEIMESVIDDHKTNIPPHLSHIFKHINSMIRRF